MSRLLLILTALAVLSIPNSAASVTECTVGNISGTEIDGQCVFFTKGDDLYSEHGCSSKNSNGYGVSSFPCPKELLKAYEEKIAAQQEKVNAEREEAERRADEELNKKIREAIEEYAKEQEKIRNDETVSAQTPAIKEPTIIKQQPNPPAPVEASVRTPAASIPETSVSEGGAEDSALSIPAPVQAASDLPEEVAPVSLWLRISKFFSHLNPISWLR